MTDVEVREVRPEEHGALAEVSLAAYRDLYSGALDEGYAAALADIDQRSADATLLVAVATAADGSAQVVGGVTYTHSSGTYTGDRDASEAGIRMLAVAPGAQGKGIGAALVSACIARARAERRSRISLHTMESMTTAHRLYERLAFRRAPGRDYVGDDYRLIAYVLDF